MGGKITPKKVAAGKRLELLRHSLDIPQEHKASMTAFAKYLDVGDPRYRKWAKGENKIPEEIVEFFLERHGVPSDWLKYGKEQNIPHWLFLAIHRKAA